MTELSLNRPAGILVKTTCVDYPSIVAGSFFLKGCNLRCPYCYNSGLVSNSNEKLNTVEELFSHLEKRKGILEGLVISGGEPLLSPYTPIIIKKGRELGYKIKLDTNGTLPDRLEFLINTPSLKPDFIAMDIKTSPEKYSALISCPESSITQNINFRELLLKSAELVSTYKADCREWRTVLVPGLVSKEDIYNISTLLPSDAIWKFSPFQQGNCLNPEYNNLSAFTDSQTQELIDYAKTLISRADLR